jgi:MFS family permease
LIENVSPRTFTVVFKSYYNLESLSLTTTEFFLQLEQRFKWDEKEQNQILGGFYWLHWVLQIPGGVLARRYGTKLVFGLSNAVCSLLLFVMPMAAHADYKILVFLRVLQGLISVSRFFLRATKFN